MSASSTHTLLFKIDAFGSQSKRPKAQKELPRLIASSRSLGLWYTNSSLKNPATFPLRHGTLFKVE